MQINQENAVVPEWSVGDRLRKARLHAGLEQTELAAQIGISRASVVNYEHGHTRPPRPVLLSWALCTGTDLGWLAGGGEILPGTFTPPAPPAPPAPLAVAA
ncbi:MAG: helix-turn-helix domain-containing protein [Streptosporangiaceae bacterium]